MDRTTRERTLNEFTTRVNLGVDANGESGLLLSGDVDRYIEQALTPLFKNKKDILKMITPDTKTGIRTTRYAFSGGKNIQESVNAAIQGVFDKLGIPIDPATGLRKDTGNPPPVSLSAIERHGYTEDTQRILAPRTAIGVRRAVFDSGGHYDFDKNTGFSKILMRRGLVQGPTRAIRKMIDDTDAKFLSGELPSASLADGASPATVEERAIAQANRKRFLAKAPAGSSTHNIAALAYYEDMNARKEARKKALFDYIAANPDSEIAKQARSRVPGAAEYMEAVQKRMDARAANQEAMLTWANKKENRNNPIAKQIRKAARNRTATGRALGKASAMAKRTAAGVAIAAISTAVITAVKFLSGIPALAANVLKIANKGASIGVTDAKMRKFQSFESRLPGLEKGAISNYLGRLQSRLIDVATGGDVEGTLKGIAPLFSKVSNGADLDRRIAEYSAGRSVDTNLLGKDLLNAVLTISMQGRTLYDDGLQPSEAMRSNAETAGRALDLKEILDALNEALHGSNPIVTPHLLEQIRKVANGEAQEINEQPVAAGRTDEAIIAALEGPVKLLKPRNTATEVEHQAAKEVATQLQDLKETFGELKQGILASILARLSGILAFVEQITRAFLTMPVFGTRFHDLVRDMEEHVYIQNVESIKEAKETARVLQQTAFQYGELKGFLNVPFDPSNPKSHAERLQKQMDEQEELYWKKTEGVPARFAYRTGEYIHFMNLIHASRTAQGKALQGEAWNKSMDTGQKVTYRKVYPGSGIGGKGEAEIEYKLGNMYKVTGTTPAQLATGAGNASRTAQKNSFDQIRRLESDKWQDKLINKLLHYFPRGGTPWSPDLNPDEVGGSTLASRRRLEANAKAALEDLGETNFGKPLPEGVEPPVNIPGEGGVRTARAIRGSTIDLSQQLIMLGQIKAQAGEILYQKLLRNELAANFRIKADDRKLVIELVDRDTGRLEKRIVDVENLIIDRDDIDVQETLSRLIPVLPELPQ